MSAHSAFSAIIACLFAATMWGLLWYPIRIMEDMGLPGVWATLMIYVFAFSVVIPLLVKTKQRWPGQVKWYVLLALAAGWTNLSFILAMLEGTVVRVLLLFYLSPVWTVIIAKLFFKEAINRTAFFNLILAFLGALILLWNTEFELILTKADALALSSGFAFAITNAVVRKIGNIPLIFKMSSAFLGVIILSMLGIFITSAVVPDIQGSVILLAAVVGILGMTAMTYAAQYAVTHLPLHQSATLFLFEVPVGAVSAALLTEEIMNLQIWIGGSMVMLAAWFSARNAIRHSP